MKFRKLDMKLPRIVCIISGALLTIVLCQPSWASDGFRDLEITSSYSSQLYPGDFKSYHLPTLSPAAILLDRNPLEADLTRIPEEFEADSRRMQEAFVARLNQTLETVRATIYIEDE